MVDDFDVRALSFIVLEDFYLKLHASFVFAIEVLRVGVWRHMQIKATTSQQSMIHPTNTEGGPSYAVITVV